MPLLVQSPKLGINTFTVTIAHSHKLLDSQ